MQANNLYLGDIGQNKVYKISTGAALTTVVNTAGTFANSGDGGAPASAAVYPFALSWRRTANTLLVFSPPHGVVREFDVIAGTSRRIAGTGTGMTSGGTLMTSGAANGQQMTGYWTNPANANNYAGSENYHCTIGSSPNGQDVVLSCGMNPGETQVVAFKVGGNVTTTLAPTFGRAMAVTFDDAGGNDILVYQFSSYSYPYGAVFWGRSQVPAGYYSSSGYGVGIACTPGYYSSSAGSTSCTQCDGSSIATASGSASCTACPSGYGANANRTACVICPAGFEVLYVTSNVYPYAGSWQCNVSSASSPAHMRIGVVEWLVMDVSLPWGCGSLRGCCFARVVLPLRFSQRRDHKDVDA